MVNQYLDDKSWDLFCSVELFFNIFLRYKVDNSAVSKQLPTLILLEGGKETKRKPFVDKKCAITPYTFSEVCVYVCVFVFVCMYVCVCVCSTDR